MKYFYRIIAILMLIITIIALIAGIFYRGFVEEEISFEVEKYGLIAVFVIFFLIDFLPQYISPYVMMATGSFAGLEGYWLLPTILVGNFLGSMAGFWLGHRIHENIVQDVFGKKTYEKMHDGMNKWGRWYVTLSAITPFPYVPIIFGSLNLSYKNFLLFGIIPRACWITLIAFLLNGIF